MQARRDFPYYNGVPVAISSVGWLIVLAAVVVAYGLLIGLPLPDFPLNFIPAILFTGLPLLALAAVSGGRHQALFGPFGLKQFGIAVAFGVLTVVLSAAVGFLMSRMVPMTSNPAVAGLADIGVPELIAFLARTFIQLIGEELITILPLLAVLWFCVSRLKLSRTTGIIAGVVVSTLWFAAIHLPTYDWNILQCLGTIGSARLVLTAAYLVTRNLWVAATAHIFNDWTLFVGGFALSHLSLGEGA